MKDAEAITKEIERLETNHYFTFYVEPVHKKESAKHLQEERIRALKWVLGD
jgi:hypothetical protein|tara:strand:- start:219 stop:371 length:153 start_codon:yes stop_codon:yes gene_type:complete